MQQINVEEKFNNKKLSDLLFLNIMVLLKILFIKLLEKKILELIL